jgi:hypothetical protein
MKSLRAKGRRKLGNGVKPARREPKTGGSDGEIAGETVR